MSSGSGRDQRAGSQSVRSKARRRSESQARRAPDPASAAPHLSLLATGVYEGKALERAKRPKDGSATKVLLFLSCHGGTGSTTLAVNVGAMLARAGRSTCVLDLDLQFGDVATALNLKPKLFISDLMADESVVDDEVVMRRVPRHGTGLAVLSQVGNVEGLAQISKKRFPKLLSRVARRYDVLLIDGVRDFNDYALSALDLADELVLVVTQDVLTLRGLALRLDVLKRLSWPIKELHVALNRHGGKTAVPREAMIQSLNIEPSFTIANDFKLVHGALNEGLTLIETSPRARVTRDIAQMVTTLFQLPEYKPGLFRRLRGGKA